MRCPTGLRTHAISLRLATPIPPIPGSPYLPRPMPYNMRVQMDQYKDVADTVMRSQIGRFGITGPQQTLAIKNLSDGLKSRVVLSWLAYKNPHMLLLDEPVGGRGVA